MFKRAVSHIEAILSFVLFIGFIFVALYFFSPTGGNTLTESTLAYALREISANTSVSMQSFSIKVNNIPPQNQGVIAVEFLTEIVTIPANYKLRVETYEGTVLAATRVGNIVYVKPLGAQFFIIKFSEDFSDNPQVSERPAVDETQYKIASAITRKALSEKRALELNRSYYLSYETLEESLELPSQNSFGFTVQLPTYIIQATNEIPAGLEVFSTVARREILKTNGELVFGEVSVRVW